MPSWNVSNGAVCLIRHVSTGLFWGQPKQHQGVWHIPAVSDRDSLQPVVFSSHTQGDLSTSDAITWGVAGDLLVQGSVAGLPNGPPQPLTLTKATDAPLSTQWTWSPASTAQVQRQDWQLHYGLPVHLALRAHDAVVGLDDSQTWIVTRSAPVMNSARDQWMLVPTFPIHVCINPRAGQCHFLEGSAVSHAMLTCEYTREGLNELECRDDVGHRVFHTADLCTTQCTVPSFECSGPPLYQCALAHTPTLARKSQTYDQCLSGCVNPVLSAVRTAQAKDGTRAASRITTRYDRSAWWSTLGVLGLSCAVLAVGVFVLAKRPWVVVVK